MITHIGELLRWSTILVVGFCYEAIYYYLPAFIVILFLLFLLALYLRRWAAVLGYLIVTAGIVVGAYRIDEFPIRVHPDEMHIPRTLMEPMREWFTSHAAMPGILALKDPAKTPYTSSLFRTRARHGARPSVSTPIVSHVYYIATKLFGADFPGCRMSSVIIGALDCLLFYLLLKKICGVTIAFTAAMVMTLDPWHLGLSRIHLPYIATNLYATGCLLVLWLAMSRPWLFIPLGVMIVFSMPMYSSIKAIYCFVPAFLIYAVVFGKWERKKLAVGIIVLLATVYPLLTVQGDDVKQLYVYGIEYGQPGAVYVWKTDGMVKTINTIFNFGWQRFVTHRGTNYIEVGCKFAPWLPVMCLAGMALCVIRIRDRRSVFLLLWLVAAVSPYALSHINPPDRRLTLVIAPVVAIACYPLTLVPMGAARNIAAAVLIALSVWGMHVGYFRSYDRQVAEGRAMAEMYRVKMNIINTEGPGKVPAK